jgi:hypothetical protein
VVEDWDKQGHTQSTEIRTREKTSQLSHVNSILHSDVFLATFLLVDDTHTI